MVIVCAVSSTAITDSLDPKDHFSPRQCDVMRDQFSRRDEQYENLLSLVRSLVRSDKETKERLRALDGWDHEAVDGL